MLLPVGWLVLSCALWRSRRVPRWKAVLFGVSLPVLLPLTDRWAAIGGVIVMVAFLLLRPLVAGGGVPSATQDGAGGGTTAAEQAQAVESPRA